MIKKHSTPTPSSECPKQINPQLLSRIQTLFTDTFLGQLKKKEKIRATLQYGKQAAYLQLQVGPSCKAMVFDFFIRQPADLLEEKSIPLLIDFASSSLEEYFKSGREAAFSLDYIGHPFENEVIYAKSEWHNFIAEKATEDFLKRHGLEGL